MPVTNERTGRTAAGDVMAEGFPDKDPEWFVEMFCRHNRVMPETVVNRAEFVYLL